MKKIYYGITHNVADRSGTIVGLVANMMGRSATEEERKAICEAVIPRASLSLAEALRDNAYPNGIVVWDRRADARAAMAELRSYESQHFYFVIGEIGDTARAMNPGKLLGWRILIDGDPSLLNQPISDIASRGTFLRKEVDHAERYGGDTDANFIFTTRADARQQMKIYRCRAKEGYTMEPVYE